MTKAEKAEVALLFMDASHFVMGCDFLGCIYGKVRRFVLTFSGRKRYNVLGAIDYVTKKVLTIANESYITATEVCAMLHKISAEYAGTVIVSRLIRQKVQLFDGLHSVCKNTFATTGKQK